MKPCGPISSAQWCCEYHANEDAARDEVFKLTQQYIGLAVKLDALGHVSDETMDLMEQRITEVTKELGFDYRIDRNHDIRIDNCLQGVLYPRYIEINIDWKLEL